MQQAVSGLFAGIMIRRTQLPQQADTFFSRAIWWLGVGISVVLACVVMHGMHTAVPLVADASPFLSSLALGSGAGGAGKPVASPQAPSAVFNPLDANCFAQGVATWVATQLQDALQPLDDQILQNPADIIDQTPAEDSYQNPTILTINNALIVVVDAALACLLILAGYTVMLGPHLWMSSATISELVPRAVLVVCAVHFNQFFLGLFIELENQLCLVVIHIAGLSMLTKACSPRHSPA